VLHIAIPKGARRHTTAVLPAERLNHRLFVDTLERQLETTDLSAYYSVASHLGGLSSRCWYAGRGAGAEREDFEDQIARLGDARSWIT
jgi:hypothetical protein